MTEQIIENINLLLKKAGNAIMKVYNENDFAYTFKDDKTPITIADKISSEIIREGLIKMFGEVNIIDEEDNNKSYEQRKNWDSFWMIDPIDGTWEFIKRSGEFCINIAYFEDNHQKIGWIYRPTTKTGWYGIKNDGVCQFDNKLTTKVSYNHTKDDIINVVTSKSHFSTYEQNVLDRLNQHYNIQIMMRGSSLKQVAICTGEADFYFKAGRCFEWDTAPGHLFIKETGGTALQLSTFQPLVYNKENLENPHFMMLGKKLNQPKFLKLIKQSI